MFTPPPPQTFAYAPNFKLLEITLQLTLVWKRRKAYLQQCAVLRWDVKLQLANVL